MAKRKKRGTTKTEDHKLVRDQMNRAIKTAIHKTVCAVRSAREYRKMLKEINVDVDEPSGISIVFTGYSMKVGGTGPVFRKFTDTGKIVWPKEFDVIRFDETFTYGRNGPQNDDSFDPKEDKPTKKRKRFKFHPKKKRVDGLTLANILEETESAVNTEPTTTKRQSSRRYTLRSTSKKKTVCDGHATK